jgi:hypothetical protein
MPVQALLLSTYELGRQPFGLASPAAWLRSAGFDVAVADLSRTRLDRDEVAKASLVGVFLPMHTATRLALPVLDRIREINSAAHICAYGLYAPANADLLRARGSAPWAASSKPISSPWRGRSAMGTVPRPLGTVLRVTQAGQSPSPGGLSPGSTSSRLIAAVCPRSTSTPRSSGPMARGA